MPYIDHPDIPAAPADDTVIWQYLSTAELLDLFDSSALHLTRADHLTQQHSDIVESQVSLGVLSGMPSESVRRSFDLMYSVQTAVFTSCWYVEGSAMHRQWQRCGGGRSQIAIRSTVKMLQASLSHVPQKLYLSGIQYIDFTNSLMPTGNVFLPALHKRCELREEREICLLMLQTGGQNTFCPGPSRGIDLNVELRSMIQSLDLAPRSAEWLRKLVRSLADRYGVPYNDSTVDLIVIREKEVCRFESAKGCGSCKHSFTPIESMYDKSLTEQICT